MTAIRLTGATTEKSSTFAEVPTESKTGVGVSRRTTQVPECSMISSVSSAVQPAAQWVRQALPTPQLPSGSARHDRSSPATGSATQSSTWSPTIILVSAPSPWPEAWRV